MARWQLRDNLTALRVAVGTLQTSAVEPGADDRLGQAFQEEQEGFCYRVVAAMEGIVYSFVQTISDLLKFRSEAWLLKQILLLGSIAV